MLMRLTHTDEPKREHRNPHGDSHVILNKGAKKCVLERKTIYSDLVRKTIYPHVGANTFSRSAQKLMQNSEKFT